MEAKRELIFESPSFTKRLKGMLGVDFYRLFHTPMFYIFLAIAAIIPAGPPPIIVTLYLIIIILMLNMFPVICIILCPN